MAEHQYPSTETAPSATTYPGVYPETGSAVYAPVSLMGRRPTIIQVRPNT